MKNITCIIFVSVFIFITGFSQGTPVDCTNPYQSALKLSDAIKKGVQILISRNQPYSQKNFKDFPKFDDYIACAKKNQGEDSEDAKKILALKNEAIKITDMNNKEEMVASADSAKTEQNKKKFKEIASKTTCPADKYTGTDKEALKNNVKAAWTKDEGCLGKYQILKVYITSETWTKEKGYDYSKSTDSFKKYDESYVNVAVVFVPKDKPVSYNGAESTEIAQIFRYSLVKDHTNGGKINYVNFECHHISGGSGTNLLSQDGKYILKSNVK